MNRINYTLFILLIFFFFAGEAIAQTVKISAEVRPRYEYRHGFKTLFPDDQTAANFISQRTRLNGFFANDMFKKLSAISPLIATDSLMEDEYEATY
jgi:hypothetical protein